MNTRNNHYLLVVGRLKPGVTESAAQADLDVIARNLERRFPENAGMGIRLQKLRDHLVGDVRPALLALFGAVLFVLLVACVNLANLMLSRAASRQKEFGIRCAMGANRTRLIRQFLIDSALLAVLGAAAGILVGFGILRAITTMLPATFPIVGSISMDPRVFGFTAILAVGSLLFFGVVPAVEASDIDPEQTLHDNQRGATQGRGSRRLKSSLVVTEIALATALLAGAGLFLKSFSQLQHQDLGFDPRNALTFTAPLAGAQYDEEDKSLAFLQESVRRIQVLPGVRSVGIGTSLPLGFGMGWGKFLSGDGLPIPATTADLPTCGFNLISPDYFKALGAYVGEGRDFNDSDTGKSQPVAIVNQAFVRRFYPKGDALGKTIRLAPPDALRAQLPPPPAGVPQAPDRAIVGIVADLKNGNADRITEPEAFAPITQYAGEGWGPGNFVVRTDKDPMALVPSVQKLIASMDPQQPIANVDSMTSLLGRSIAQSRFNTMLLTMFAGLVVLLAAVGIYGVISYGVSNRTHEIGVRMALGADRTSVLKMVLRESFLLTAIGLMAGVALALVLSRLVRTLLFGVGTTDPAVYIFTILVLAVVAMAATLLPARRAAVIEPMQALRAE
jgi:putative ABC transport system permease protein